MTRSSYVLVLAALFAGGSSIQAQARPQPQEPKPTVPRSHLPPPGMCRIWLDNVPPSQQPAPTDCASPVLLIRNAQGVWFAAGIPSSGND